MLGHLQILLEGIANHPEQCLSHLPLLTPAESQQVLVVWNNTMRDYEHVPCIHQRVESQVSRTPDAVAVTCEEEALTYRELNQRANQLARYLRRLGVGPEVLVGLCMEPSLEMVIGLLGILKSGGAYVPLDPTYPADRLALMIEDAHVSVLLTQEDLVETLPDSTDVRQVCLYKHRGVIDQETDENLENWTMPENLAYVMYTSGSTGRPKGVMISHRGIGNRLQWGQETYQLTDTDRVLQKDSVSFDTSVWKFFGPLFVGAQLVVAPPGARQDPAWLVTLVTQHQITITGWTASALQVFLEEKGNNPCHSLRQVLCGGEALSLKVQERFFACLNGKLHNLYGPTEVSIDVTCWECNPSRSPHTIPIGRPIANTQAYLLDGHGNPVPIGVPGELYFGGTGLARGYFNGPDLTAERFVPNLYSDQPGARLYRTGDIARYLSDGNLEFLGRRDYQVKLRGYRIELGEIETALIQHPAVWEAVVLLCEDRLGEKRLVAYVVREKETPLSIATLRNFLHMKLPDYMIPSALVFLDALPLTTHGKVNRQALPLPDEKSVSSAEQFVAPKTPIESHLATLWEEVLNIKRVGIYDNFFALGGHSLLAFKLISRIRHDLDVELPIRALFYNPTIAGLVMIITEQEDL
jgi:amino acid adenylation domain-containing protein